MKLGQSFCFLSFSEFILTFQSPRAPPCTLFFLQGSLHVAVTEKNSRFLAQNAEGKGWAWLPCRSRPLKGMREAHAHSLAAY